MSPGEDIQRKVEHLLHSYVQTIDDDRLEEWPEFFVDDCLYRIIPRDNYDRGLPAAVMYCDSKGMLQDRIVSLRKANIYPPHYSRHLLSNIRITGKEGGCVHVESNYVVLQTRHGEDTVVYNTGKYLDRIRMDGDAPRFEEKTVVYDSFRIRTLLVTPI